MRDKKAKKIIKSYIDSYNKFDVLGMTKNLDDNIVFKNISDKKISLCTKGIEAFEHQATAAKAYFTMRNQEIKSWYFENEKITVHIDYSAVLAIDISDELKAGNSLNIEGKSEFVIENSKIKEIWDYDSR